MDAKIILVGFHIVLLTVCVLQALGHGAKFRAAGAPSDRMATFGMALLMWVVALFNAFALSVLGGVVK